MTQNLVNKPFEQLFRLQMSFIICAACLKSYTGEKVKVLARLCSLYFIPATKGIGLKPSYLPKSRVSDLLRST